MKLQYLALISSTFLLSIGCQKVVSVNSPSESPVVQQTQAPVTQTSDNRSTELSTLKSGTFVSGEHPTQGTVRVANKNGKVALELDQAFKTSEKGPDLVVILHRSDNIIGSTKPPAYPINEGDYVILAPLQKFSGAQSYVIPENIKLEDYKSAAIWCRKFNATFGAAKLNS